MKVDIENPVRKPQVTGMSQGMAHVTTLPLTCLVLVKQQLDS
jgi:hypothetical protein